MFQARTQVVDAAQQAVHRGAEGLFATRRADGVFDFGTTGWTSVLATVGAISALHAADPVRSADLVAGGVRWLCRVQQQDGGWSTVPGVASEAGPTAVACATLHMIAPEEAADAVATGRAWLGRAGGLDAVTHREMAAVCRRFYAMAGWLDQNELPRLPLHLAAFPALFRRLLDFRAPLVAAAALAQARTRPGGPVRRVLNRMGTPGALRIIRQIHEHEGMTGEFSDDPWAAGLTCGALARAGVAGDLVGLTVEWLRAKANPDGSWNMMPLDLTWSSYAAAGLLDAGYGEDERLAATRATFQSRQQDKPFEAFGTAPGFWGWSSPHGWPASVETAEVASVLARLPGGRNDAHVTRAVEWLFAQQDSRGSWSLCVRNTLVANCGPCPHTTAQAVEALLHAGVPVTDQRVARAVRWLLSSQGSDGTFDSVWYRRATSGTSVVVSALARCGHADHPVVRRAVGWLTSTQLADGMWGTGDSTSPGTVEETAWAVCALLAAGGADAAVERGVRALLEAQQADGQWPRAAVSEFVREASRFPNGGLTNGLALRALSGFVRDAARRQR